MLSRLLTLSFQEDGYQATPREVDLALSETAAAIENGQSEVLLAMSPTEPEALGMIEVRHMSGPPLGRHYLIGRLVVLPAYRGGRVARALILAAVESMTEAIPILTMTVGKRMPRSYKRLGAVVIGEVAAGSVEDVKRRLYGRRGITDHRRGLGPLLGGEREPEPEAGGKSAGGDREEPDPASKAGEPLL